MLWNKGSIYKMYIFEESIKRYTIDYKGRGRREVIYLYVADINYTQSVRKSMGLSYGGSCSKVL